MTFGGVSLSRLLHLAGVLGRHLLAGVLGPRAGRWPWLARRLPAETSEPERLRALLEELGGTFIKLGQMLALQPDILPLAYCNALFNLLDRVPAFSFEEVERTFLEELDATPAALFDAFEPRPIAAASIGQVHLADLEGRKVAVKVQRPSARKDFTGDIRLMKIAMALIRRLRLKRFEWMVEPMSEFVVWTEEELDYRCEARYMGELRVNGRDQPCQRVPRVYEAYTTRRTLVMDFFAGVTVLDYLRAREQGDEIALRRLSLEGFEHERFAGRLIDNFLEQAFEHGLFHADLHPANLMILPGNVVGYLDFGITGGLSPFSRRRMVALTLAYSRGDLDRMIEALFEISAMPARPAVDLYRERMNRLAEDWYEIRDGKLRLCKSFTVVMLELFSLFRATDIWPEREVIKYFRSAIAIDGLISRFAPGIDLGTYLESACARRVAGSAMGPRVSASRLFAWPAASARRMLDGGLRAAEAFERLASGELEVRAELGERSRRDVAAEGWSAVLLGAFVLVSTILILDAERVDLGWNPFTAQALLMAGSLWILLGKIRRLAGPASAKETSDAHVLPVSR